MTPGTPTAQAGLTDTPTLRARARQNIDEGAVTQSYGANRQAVIDLLNEALATELVCVLRYKLHAFTATGINSEPVKAEFMAHANEELGHADLIARRIVELRGKPDFCPDRLSARSHAEYVEVESLADMIRENLVAERIAIESYRESILYLESKDPTTQRMLKDILAVEEEHADDLVSLLEGVKG